MLRGTTERAVRLGSRCGGNGYAGLTVKAKAISRHHRITAVGKAGAWRRSAPSTSPTPAVLNPVALSPAPIDLSAAPAPVQAALAPLFSTFHP